MDDLEHRGALVAAAGLSREHGDRREVAAGLAGGEGVDAVGEHPDLHPRAVDAEGRPRRGGGVGDVALGGDRAGVGPRLVGGPHVVDVVMPGERRDGLEGDAGPHGTCGKDGHEDLAVELVDEREELGRHPAFDIDLGQPCFDLGRGLQVRRALDGHFTGGPARRVQQPVVELLLGRGSGGLVTLDRLDLGNDLRGHTEDRRIRHLRGDRWRRQGEHHETAPNENGEPTTKTTS